MRLWSLHPKYLDRIGLIALWREGLLAKRVLEGKTKGYKNHPQLERFKKFKEPLLAINSYLFYVYEEAKKRGYNFNRKKLSARKIIKKKIPITTGQINFEFSHLCKKVKKRDKNHYQTLCKEKQPIEPNPIFYLIPGDIEEWEKTLNID